MNASPPHHPQLPRRPRPSPGLLFTTIVLALAAIIAAGACLWFAVQVAMFVPIIAGTAVAVAVVLLFMAYFLQRAVFRLSHPDSELALVGLLIGGSIAAVIALLTIATGNARPDAAHWPGIVVVVIAVWSIIAAHQMHAWSQRLRYYHTFKPYCGPCGYNLIGTIAADGLRCPECGAVIPYEKVSRYRPPREPESQTDADHHD